MAKFERESLAEGVQKRFDALTEYERQAVAVIMEAYDYSLEEALKIVESGKYAYYPGVTSLAALAYVLVHDRGWFNLDPAILAEISAYIDYDKLGAALYSGGCRETRFGAVLIFEDSLKNKIK